MQLHRTLHKTGRLFIDEKGRNFADLEAKAKAIQAAAKNSYRLPVTVNSSVNQAMAVSIATMRALEKQIKVLDKAKGVNKYQHKRALALTAKKLVRLVFRLLKDNRLYKTPDG